MTDDKLLTPKEVSVLIGKSYKTTLKHIKSGVIPSVIRKNEKNLDTYWVKQSVVKMYVEGEKVRVETPTSTINTSSYQGVRGDGRNEVEVLRQRVSELEMDKSFLIQQIQVKDKQINDFTTIVDRLQQTNQYLLLEGSKTIDTSPSTPSRNKPLDDVIDIPTDKPFTKDRIIKLVNEMVDKGYSYRDLSQYLNENQIPTLSGSGKWFHKTIYRIRKRYTDR